MQISNLGFDVVDQDIIDLFGDAEIGPIISAGVSYDRSGRSTGMAVRRSIVRALSRRRERSPVILPFGWWSVGSLCFVETLGESAGLRRLCGRRTLRNGPCRRSCTNGHKTRKRPSGSTTTFRSTDSTWCAGLRCCADERRRGSSSQRASIGRDGA